MLIKKKLKNKKLIKNFLNKKIWLKNLIKRLRG